MSKVRKAVVYSSATRYTTKLLGLLSTMVIARLLTPSEVGTFAIASAIVMVMSEFRLLGAGTYLIREKELDNDKIRSATGLTVLISWGMGGLIWAIAPLASTSYELPPLLIIFRILSVSFFLAPFVSIPISLMTRDFKFREIFIIKFITTVTQLALTIALIKQGFSYFSLAWGQTIAVVLQFMLIAYFRPVGLPWAPAFNNLGAIAQVGIFTSLANFLRRGVVAVPDMILGKMGTTAQVGIFSRGLGFVEFVSQTLMMGIGPVALPYLSETKRSGGNMSWAYIRASVLLGGIIWPIMAVCNLVSLPAIRLFFGGQWDAAAPLAAWLAIWTMFRSTHWLSNSLLTASGKEKIMVVKELVVFSVYFVGIILAFPYGLERVAMLFVVASVLDLVVTSILLWWVLQLDMYRFAMAWLPNIAVAAVCWGVTLSISQFIAFESSNYWLPILVVAVVLPPVWLVSLKVLGHPLYVEIARLLQGILARAGLGGRA
jgi:O-antigen/teichoic acid export membrane protein